MKNKKFSIILFLISLVSFIINIKNNFIFNSFTLIASIVLVYFTYSKKNNLFKTLFILGVILLITNSIIIYFMTLIYSIYIIYKINKSECNFKEYLNNKTLYGIIILLVYGFGIALIGNYIFNIVNNFIYGKEFICESLSLISAFILSIVVGKKEIFNKNNLKFFKSLLTGGVIFVTSIIVLISQIFYGLNNGYKLIHIKDIILICLLYIILGFFEEILIRGIILDSLLNKYFKNKKEIFLSIFTSSIIFGLIHFINLSFGASIYSVIAQVIFAITFGIYLGCLYVRTRNIYACSIIHALWDLSLAIPMIFNLNKNVKAHCINLGSLIIYIPIIFFGLFLLRKNKINEIIYKDNKKQKEKIISKIGRILLLLIIVILCFIIGTNVKVIIGKC